MPHAPPQVSGTSSRPIPRISPGSRPRPRRQSCFCSAAGDGCFPRHGAPANACSPASALPPTQERPGWDTAAKEHGLLPGLGQEGSQFCTSIIPSNWTAFHPLPGIIPYVVGLASQPPASQRGARLTFSTVASSFGCSRFSAVSGLVSEQFIISILPTHIFLRSRRELSQAGQSGTKATKISHRFWKCLLIRTHRLAGRQK